VKTSSRRLKPDSCQTHQHKTDRLTTDSRQTLTPPDTTIASFAFLATRVTAVRTFPASHERRTRPGKPNGHGCYIMSILLLLIVSCLYHCQVCSNTRRWQYPDKYKCTCVTTLSQEAAIPALLKHLVHETADPDDS
jgi:hypothetical protein